MRISWLDPAIIRIARAALTAHHSDWSVHFMPEFRAPPAPEGIDHSAWPRIAEHVARVERVSQDIRERGLEAAMARFRGSGHAVELATLILAAAQVNELEFALLAELLACDIDELVAYGTFLDLLESASTHERDQALAVYERFCAAFAAKSSQLPMWSERVRAVRDGLASFYVRCGRLEAGHELFLERHEEDPDSLVAALSASRAFLAGGSVSRAVVWLGLAVERADALGRPSMAERLRTKQENLRRRQS